MYASHFCQYMYRNAKILYVGVNNMLCECNRELTEFDGRIFHTNG